MAFFAVNNVTGMLRAEEPFKESPSTHVLLALPSFISVYLDVSWDCLLGEEVTVGTVLQFLE